MPKELAHFKRPPLVETAISVQFDTLEEFGNAHLGLFWNRVRDRFPDREDATPIEPQIERFGSQASRARLPEFRVAPPRPAARLQMASTDGHLMLQIQNGRLVFNWRRLKDGQYPTWKNVKPGFFDALGVFSDFLSGEGLGCINPNQWEVTYANHLLKGREWQSPAEWSELLPGMIGAVSGDSGAEFETCGVRTHYVLPNQSGRLHIELRHAFVEVDEEEESEALVLHLTARGAVSSESELSDRLERAHEAIVTSFSRITGQAVRDKVWCQIEGV